MAHGPSYFSTKEAADDAQREYDDAVRHHRPEHVIKDAERERNRTRDRLAEVERTGE